MPGKIEATVEPKTLIITGGENIEATATLRNAGQGIDQLSLAIEGLDQSWYTMPVSSVALFPNDQDKIKLVFHPANAANLKAGSYPFRLKVTSQEGNTELVDLALEVRPLVAVELSASPQRINSRKGNYSVVANNPGGMAATLQLKAGDSHRRLRYKLQPQSLNVPANGRSEATLEARLKWYAWIGGEKEFPFEVQAMPQDTGRVASPPAAATANLVRPQIRIPWFSRPPAIGAFKSTTEDKREFKLVWVVRRATTVKLEGEQVDARGERIIFATEPVKLTLTATNKYGTTTQTVDIQPLPLPKARTSDRIRATLSHVQLQAQAGGPHVQAMLQVQNLSDIVDKFVVDVEGIDGSWYNRSASSLALMPRASDQVTLSFHPPKKRGVRSKSYPFAVTVRSQSVQNEATIILGEIEVLPAVEFKVKAQPFRLTCHRKGTFRINLANASVSDARVTMSATDLEEALRFEFKDSSPLVPAWSTIDVPMIVRPKRGSIIGEKKRFDITINATGPGGMAQTTTAEFNHDPYISSWKTVFKIIRAILVIGVLVVAVVLVANLGGGCGAFIDSPQGWVKAFTDTVTKWFSR